MPSKDSSDCKPQIVILDAARRHAETLQPRPCRSALLLPIEDAGRLQALYEGYYDHFRPTTIVESTLIDQMVASIWRFNRTIGYESLLLTARAEEQLAAHQKTYTSPDMERLYSNVAESVAAGLAQLNRILVTCRNTFRGALSDFEKVRKLKADPTQPSLPPPSELTAPTNFSEPTPPAPARKNVVEMPLRTPPPEPAAEKEPQPPAPEPPPPAVPSEPAKRKHEWFECEDYTPPDDVPEPPAAAKPDTPVAAPIRDVHGNPVTIHHQEKPTFQPGDFEWSAPPEVARLLKDLLDPKK